MKEKTFLGLDVGSNSVGWCVTDNNFKIKKINGVDAWGVRLFDEASDAKGRRTFRSQKRRIQRRKSRIYLLNRMFVNEITKYDDSFFIRMEESNFVLNDKTTKLKHVFFQTADEEKNFYKRYPTIYHLRKALIDNDEYAFSNIKHVYIALHHIIKYRGNFLTENAMSFDNFSEENIKNLNDHLNILLAEYNEDGSIESTDFLDPKKSNDLIEILHSSEFKDKKSKSKAIYSLFDKNVLESADKNFLDDCIKFFADLCVGSKHSFKNEDGDKKEYIIDTKIDENINQYEKDLGNKFYLLLDAKACYDFAYLKRLLNRKKYLSDAFVEVYENHKKRLKELKDVINEIDTNKGNKNREIYNKVFYENNLNTPSSNDKKEKAIINYYSFIKTNENSKSGRADVEGFNSFIKKILEENKDYVKSVDKYDNLVSLCEKNELLLKISNVSTSVIPHQLHEYELEKILKNAKTHFAFIDDSFVNRIIKIFKFRIPYYYGPLNSTNWGNVKIKEEYANKKITFDNFDEIIDVKETKNSFINNRLNKCQYLYTKNVLPRNSIYYVVYDLLDKLNTMCYKGKHLSSDEVNQALKIICESDKPLSVFALNKQLKTIYNGESKYNLDDITGIDIANYKFNGFPIKNFLNIYDGSKDKLQVNIKEAEDIIKILTIYKDNKNDGIDYIKEKYPYLKANQIKEIRRLPKLTGYGKFSYELLNDIKYNNQSILELLLTQGLNFNQIIFSENFGLREKIEELNRAELNGSKPRQEIAQEILDEMPAKMRRPVIQTLKIIKDVVRFNKQPLDVISIETTRRDLMNEEKKTKDTRIKEIEKFIKTFFGDGLKGLDNNLVDSSKIVKDEFTEKQKEIEFKNEIKGKHLYLYFKQMGIDMYTGEHINIDDIFDSTKYDLDHIIPQSKIKDDSLDNLVLVSREKNQNVKKDIYPIPSSIRNKMEGLWKMMYEKGCISKKKYTNLIRSDELSEEELNDFVNAQINVVDYANTRIRDIIKILYPNTEIVFSKAQYPSEIRHEYNIYKIRDLNDCHHAFDAYLNVVSGILLNQRFNYKYKFSNYILDDTKHDEEKTHNFLNYLKFKLNDLNLLETLKEYYLRTDMLFTYKISYEEDAFYKQTIYKKGVNLIPLHTKGKMNDTSKYGGYSSKSSKYFYIGTKTDNKGLKTKVLVTVDCLNYALCCKNGKLNSALLIEKLSKENPDIVIDSLDRIQNYQKVIVDGKEFLIRSKNEQAIKLIPMFYLPYSFEHLKVLRALYKNSVADDKGFFLERANQRDVFLNIEDVKKYITEIKNEVSDYYNNYLSYTPFIASFNKLDELLNKEDVSINDLLKSLLNLIDSMNRAPKIVNPCCIAKTSILKKTQFLVEETPTGLFKKYIKI